jgi:hypothetical protein
MRRSTVIGVSNPLQSVATDMHILMTEWRQLRHLAVDVYVLFFVCVEFCVNIFGHGTRKYV